VDKSHQLQAVYDAFFNLSPTTLPWQTTPHNSEFPDSSEYLDFGIVNDEKFNNLYNGNRPYGNESTDDYVFMIKAGYWGDRSIVLMKKAFFKSPHYATKDPAHKKKCEREDYIERTIKNALSALTSTAREEGKRCHSNLKRQNSTPALLKASDVPYEPPRFLIKPYFQRGKGTLIQADNGTGKTAFMCAIAAHISTGRAILDIHIETPGNVLILSVEDDLPVLRGRIEENGGDLEKCYFLSNAAGLTFNSQEVEKTVKQIEAKLVIFDPFQAFIGENVKMDKSNETRPKLAKLFEMADRNDCAIAIIAHIGKGSMSTSPVNRSLGSVDIPAAMRSIIQLTRNPDDESELIAVHVKCSNAPKGRSIAFAVVDRGGVQWHGFSDMTVEDLSTIVKRKEKGIPYEDEPLVRVFKQLIADRPGGGFWSYGDLANSCMKILGFPPYSSHYDLKTKLEGSLSRELQEREGLIVTCGHRHSGQRGIRIERYKDSIEYRIKSPFDMEDT